MIEPTPLLDFFKRGEVSRDVRLLAARGVLAPRASEQMAILVLLVEDPDTEVRQTAELTLTLIPAATLRTFLGRADVPIGIREFFADRGMFPADTPAIEVEEGADSPLVDTDLAAEEPEEDAEGKMSVAHRLAEMSFTERLKAAIKGSREMRSILIRDTNRMIAAAVLSSPRLTDSEIENFARMTSVGEEVLRMIGNNRGWMKRYPTLVALTRNPKTPLAMSLNLMQRLNDKDLGMLSVDRNVPETLRTTARRKVANATSRR